MRCLAFISTAHSLSTCRSLEWCGTCKRLMSTETFRHNQITDRHCTDISRVDKQHARCRHTTGGRYYCGSTSGIAYRECTYIYFSTWQDTIFNYYFKKREEIVFPQFLGRVILARVPTRYLDHLFCYRSLEISSNLSNESI